ncbi:MAG TPA: signal peptidase I [Anaerolineales bacterium]|nr:signal peptidase I [Anaerolineae bacterium]HIQ01149.1 signal peptidase I [Anaerolineales bacterium]
MESVPEPISETPEPQEDKPGLASSAGRFLLRVLREVVGTVLPAVLIALLINLFLAQATVVQGQSMEPSLHNDERVIVEKVTYRLIRGPRRGDVVIIEVAGQPEPLIKRVVGLPGETVAVQGGQVFINGQPLEEEWAVQEGGPDYPPTRVPPLHIFVLGDNRGHSNDSRSFGPVLVDQVLGRAWLVYWPLEEVGPVH